MLALDDVSDKDQAAENAREKNTLYAISVSGGSHFNSTFKSTKQEFLNLFMEIEKKEVRFLQASNRFHPFKEKKPSISSAALVHFVRYCRALKLADKQLCIDPSPVYQTSLVFLILHMCKFFYQHLQILTSKEDQIWEQQHCKLGFTKQDSQIYVSIHMLTSYQLQLYKLRENTEKLIRDQEFMRAEVIKHDKSFSLSELPPWNIDEMKNLEHELLHTDLLDLDDACLVLQCVERMYQSISRGIYLLEMRKTLSLYNQNSADVKFEKAVVKIQASVSNSTAWSSCTGDFHYKKVFLKKQSNCVL